MGRLVVFDIDGVLSGGGPVTVTHLATLEKDGDVIAVASPSVSYPRNATGAPRWPRFVEAQANGRPRAEDLAAASRAFPDCAERIYVDDQAANRSIADAAGFSFMSPAELVRSIEFEYVPDHDHSQRCIVLDPQGRWIDLTSGAIVGASPLLEEIIPNKQTPRGPIPDRLRIARFPQYRDNVPRADELTWAQFTDEFSRHARAAVPDGDIPLWNSVRYSELGRHRPSPASPADVVSASMAVLDSDGIPAERIAASLRARGLAFVIHSTWSHVPRYPHLRIIVPYTEPLPFGSWAGVAQALAWLVGSVPCSPERFDLGRWYRCPLARAGADVVSIVGAGEGLDWRGLPDVSAALVPPTIPVQFGWRRRARPDG